MVTAFSSGLVPTTLVNIRRQSRAWTQRFSVKSNPGSFRPVSRCLRRKSATSLSLLSRREYEQQVEVPPHFEARHLQSSAAINESPRVTSLSFSETRVLPVAVLYQALPPPEIDGILKPKKPGGYSDSGADIAYVLRESGQPTISPVHNPQLTADYHWVFPDTLKGIETALQQGARILWANTTLFQGHPLESVEQGVRIVGQLPEKVQMHDDKWTTNKLLRARGLSVAKSVLVSDGSQAGTVDINDLTMDALEDQGVRPPWIIKPVRGRGSQGVVKIDSLDVLKTKIKDFLSRTYELDGKTISQYGYKYIVEEYLSGEEVTVSVMPPGLYRIKNKEVAMHGHWSLPIIERFDHENGIAPYSVERPVVTNSYVLSEHKLRESDYADIAEQCEKAAELIGATAPIRIDARRDRAGRFCIFDLNMKPNMTGAGRPGRENQDGLTAIAARAIGWNYSELLLNILNQARSPVTQG